MQRIVHCLLYGRKCGHTNPSAYSGGNNDFVTTRAFDGDGNYLRTVYPYPANLSAAQVSGFGINNWLNGKYSPQSTSASWPSAC